MPKATVGGEGGCNTINEAYDGISSEGDFNRRKGEDSDKLEGYKSPIEKPLAGGLQLMEEGIPGKED